MKLEEEPAGCALPVNVNAGCTERIVWFTMK